MVTPVQVVAGSAAFTSSKAPAGNVFESRKTVLNPRTNRVVIGRILAFSPPFFGVVKLILPLAVAIIVEKNVIVKLF